MYQRAEQELKGKCPQDYSEDSLIIRRDERLFCLILESLDYAVRRMKERERKDKTDYKEVKELVEDLTADILLILKNKPEDEHEALEQYKQKCIEGCQKLIQRCEALLRKTTARRELLSKM